jgi:hypothetical protein
MLAVIAGSGFLTSILGPPIKSKAIVDPALPLALA